MELSIDGTVDYSSLETGVAIAKRCRGCHSAGCFDVVGHPSAATNVRLPQSD